ncbi:MAG: tetratricopeptide repeat protein [Promethearchaeota archaeon]|jgi:tetratricopeptide (TPR) repeat protein
MSYLEPKELFLIKQLIEECKLDEANQLLKNFEEKGGHTLQNIVLSHLLKCDLLFWRGLHKDVIKLAEQTYKESLGLEKNLLSVDILLRMADALVWHKQSDNLNNIIKQVEGLLKALPQEISEDYKKRKAYLAYLKGWYYILIDEADQALKHLEYSLALREELNAKKDMAITLIAISWVYTFLKSDYDQALKFSKQARPLAEESGNKWVIGYSLSSMSVKYYGKGDLEHFFMLSDRGLAVFHSINNEFMIGIHLNNRGVAYIRRGELDRALKTLERGMIIAEESGIKWLIGFSSLSMASVYMFKGDLDRGIKLYEQALTIFSDLNIKRWIAGVLNNMGEAYRQRGELDRALECIEQCLVLYEDSGNLRRMANFYDYLIQTLIEKGDLERSQQFLHLYEQLNNQLKEKDYNLRYLLNKALLLKTSTRAHNRAEAEKILKQILEDKDENYELTIKTLTNLCELLLTELRMTNDLEVLEEIKPLIAQLLNIAENTGSFSVQCETYLLKAKLSLLTFDMKETQRFLTQAQQIAEKFGLKLLAIKISNEHDDLLKQLNVWESLKASSSSIKDRMEFARLNEQLENMVRRRVVEAPQLSDEDPVLLLVVSEGGIPIFSQSFTEQLSLENDLLGSFFTAINSFINEKFSEGLDRATFGEHTLLMNSVSPFLMCYVYKGQSYSAQQRIRYFIDELQKDKDTWQTFRDFYRLNKEIQVKDIPSLEPMITKIFIDKSVPLIA